MDQPDESNRSKWYSRIAWFFLTLFAIFWSLGSFFFWVLLGSAAIFATLALHSSGKFFSLFNTNGPSVYNAPSGNSTTNANPNVNKILVVIFIVVGAAIVFIGLGIFSDHNYPEKEIAETDTTLDSLNNSESVPDNSEEEISLVSKGTVYFNNGNYDSALYFYDRALTENPTDQDAIYNRALVFFVKKEHRKSIHILKDPNQQYDESNEGLWLLGDNYYELTQYDSALIFLEKAYNNDFEHPDFLELLGDAYSKNNDRTKAKDMYLKSVAKNPDNNGVYERLIEIDPDNADAYREKINSNKDSKQ